MRIVPTLRPQDTTFSAPSASAQPGSREAFSLLLDRLTRLAGPAASGLSRAENPLPFEMLLVLGLAQLVERLSALADQTRPAVPQGLPVSGPISQHYQPGHRAVDLAVPVGTPVRATLAGRVIHAGWDDSGYGNLVILENGPYRTYYAHLDRIPVGMGQAVEAGTVVGLSGNTGRSTGPHLHYEVRLNGSGVNPLASPPAPLS